MSQKKLSLAGMLAVLALVGAGCGSSSSSSSSGGAAGSSGATSSAAPANPNGGATGTSSTTPAGGAGGSGSSASTPNSGGAGMPSGALAFAVAKCKSRIAAAPGLSADSKNKLSELCTQVGQGNVSNLRKITAQVCEQTIKQSVPAGAAQNQALASCPKP